MGTLLLWWGPSCDSLRWEAGKLLSGTQGAWLWRMGSPECFMFSLLESPCVLTCTLEHGASIAPEPGLLPCGLREVIEGPGPQEGFTASLGCFVPLPLLQAGLLQPQLSSTSTTVVLRDTPALAKQTCGNGVPLSRQQGEAVSQSPFRSQPRRRTWE